MTSQNSFRVINLISAALVGLGIPGSKGITGARQRCAIAGVEAALKVFRRLAAPVCVAGAERNLARDRALLRGR